MKACLRYCFWILVILSTQGCQFLPQANVTSELPGGWRLSGVESIHTKTNSFFEEQASLQLLVKEGYVVNLFSDGTCTELRGEDGLKTGQWTAQESQHTLSFASSVTKAENLPFQMEKNAYGKLVMTLTLQQRPLLLHFTKEGSSLQNFRDDPFCVNNLQWRIKPSKPETTEELQRRMAAYLKHVALVLNAASERKQDIVSFAFSKGPIQIYNGGIGIYPYHLVPDSWKACFYDDGDARKAYQLYEAYLRTGHYRGGGTGDWVRDDYNILLSIYAGLQEADSKKATH